jgi:hypothetical protein
MMLCYLSSPDLRPCLQPRKTNADDVDDDDGGNAECAVSQSQTCLSVARATAVVSQTVESSRRGRSETARVGWCMGVFVCASSESKALGGIMVKQSELSER